MSLSHPTSPPSPPINYPEICTINYRDPSHNTRLHFVELPPDIDSRHRFHLLLETTEGGIERVILFPQAIEATIDHIEMRQHFVQLLLDFAEPLVATIEIGRDHVAVKTRGCAVLIPFLSGFLIAVSHRGA